MYPFGFNHRLLADYTWPIHHFSGSITFGDVPMAGDELNRIFIVVLDVDRIYMQILGAMRKGMPGPEITFHPDAYAICRQCLHRTKVKNFAQCLPPRAGHGRERH